MSCSRWLGSAAYSLIFSVALATTNALGASPLQIMPLGDSITDGVPVPGGYRTQLYNDLIAPPGTSFNFVGSATDNYSQTLFNAGQIHHEGHSGFRIDQIASNIDASGGGSNWLNGVQPDFILLLIGTNDFGQNVDPANAINRLDSLISQITTDRPNAHLIVSNLLLRTDSLTLETQIETEFNPFVPGIVANHAALGQKVTFIDLHSVVPAGDLPDGLHPNQDGYDKMGNAWFGATEAIPEPTSLALLFLSASGFLARRRA